MESALPRSNASFHDQFVTLFDAQYPRIARVLDRLSGDADLASDLAQEAFIRLYRRGSMPDSPGAWVISVAMNLFRNEMNSRQRRNRLLRLVHGGRVVHPPPPSAQQSAAAENTHRRVRRAVDGLPERERRLLLLQAEGYSYREIAAALELHEASIGTLLARARRAFRAIYEGPIDASE